MATQTPHIPTMSDRQVGQGAAVRGRPPRILLAVNRSGLERRLDRCPGVRVVGCVRDAIDLRRHLIERCADGLILAVSFCSHEDRGLLDSVPTSWIVCPVAAPARSTLMAALLDITDAWRVLSRLTRRFGRP